MEKIKFKIVLNIKGKRLFEIRVPQKILELLLRKSFNCLDVKVIRQEVDIYTFSEFQTLYDIFDDFSFIKKTEEQLKKELGYV